MAPSAVSTETSVDPVANSLASLKLQGRSLNAEAYTTPPNPQNPDEEPYLWTRLLPVFDPSEHYPPLTPYEHVDPGFRALSHPNPRSFLSSATRVADLTPHIGTEIEGVNLATLDADGRDQLALEAARRGVLVFRDQEEFLNSRTDAWKKWGEHFGRLHIHPTSGHPAGVPEIHLVYRDSSKSFNFEQDDHITSTVWHSDVSYEANPPGLTTFFLLAQPTTGGDTLFVSQTASLRRLSPTLVDFLRSLNAVHSAVSQAEYSRSGKRGGVVRREPVENVHPVVRKHPVTGEEALYVNSQFTTKIVGLKKEESDNLLNFLYDHVARGADSQVRVNWRPNTVVCWDNRVTAHTAIIDYGATGQRRHGARITPQAERPTR